tara:strand:+ start:317 stop:571 length:255 start_codon:yes stop_codon:yes gene_type:complete
MAFERKNLIGAAFKNDNKSQDWHSDYRGDILVDGTDYYLDIKKAVPANGGNAYLRATLKPKNASAANAATAQISETSDVDDFDF